MLIPTATPKTPAASTADTLATLAATIHARRTAKSDASYTRQLLDKGHAHCARKFGEEAVEAIVAALGTSKDDLTNEAADVLYHLLVLLESRDVALSDVLATLQKRMASSGIAEKAARTQPPTAPRQTTPDKP